MKFAVISSKNLKILGKVILSSLFALVLTWYGSSYLPSQIVYLQSRDDFVKAFARTNHNRVFWSEKFYRNLSEREDQASIENAWSEYSNSVNDWNSENVYNALFIEYYFGLELRSEFESTLPPAFIGLHEHLLELKKFGTTTTDIAAEIEWVKNRTFHISEKMLGIEKGD